MSAAWENYLKVSQEIGVAAIASGRQPADIHLVAVSKKVPADIVNDFLSAADRPIILGESYVQEFLAKRNSLTSKFESHLIGPLQSNKVKMAVGEFAVIESVHNKKIFNLIARRAQDLAVAQRVFLQVNISADPAKQGFAAAELMHEYQQMVLTPNIKIEGLMTITMNYAEPEKARPDFIALRNLRDLLNPELKLSMGMSADYAIAIAEGADFVRIGSAIFGERI